MMTAKALVVVTAAGFLIGCGMIASSDGVVREMGELTTVGPMNYTVLEAEWQTQLGQSVEAVIPRHKFLLVRLQVSNGGNQQVALPLLRLVDAWGETHMELSDVKGVPDWLGLLRILDPATTMQGTIVFDVPAGDYKLQVTDAGDLENERTALIQIPLMIRPPGVIETPGQTPGVPHI